MFLVQNEGKIRLMSFKSNPWLSKEEHPKKGTSLHKHSLFIFTGVLARPKLIKEEQKSKTD